MIRELFYGNNEKLQSFKAHSLGSSKVGYLVQPQHVAQWESIRLAGMSHSGFISGPGRN